MDLIMRIMPLQHAKHDSSYYRHGGSTSDDLFYGMESIDDADDSVDNDIYVAKKLAHIMSLAFAALLSFIIGLNFINWILMII